MANLGYLQLTRNCLQRCRFCSNPPTGVDLTVEDMKKLIDGLVDLGYDGVILTGGEPTLSPLLLPALEYASEKGLFNRMITNGQRFADKEFFQKCVDHGLQHIHVSLHSYRQEVHDFITQYKNAWSTLIDCLTYVPQMGITCDINTVINTYNADHLDETVEWICTKFPFIRHFVWNNMDPDGNRAEDNPDCIAKHYEFMVSLEKAMDFLHRTGRTFRAERVPLCFMKRYPWASTETRKIIKEEERCIQFLDNKGFVHQLEFLHGKGKACDHCRWDGICAGMFSMAKSFDERELSPIFEDPLPVVRSVLGRDPEQELIDKLNDRKGQRSTTEQPSVQQREQYESKELFAEIIL